MAAVWSSMSTAAVFRLPFGSVISLEEWNSMVTDRLPNRNTAITLLAGAVSQIRFARRYTLQLLDATPRDCWFEMPGRCPTNIAWQVGHLAVSQYGLLMFRIRGRAPEDVDLVPGRFRKAYSRESVPDVKATVQPSPDALFERLAHVHQLAMAVLDHVDPDVLLDPVDLPWAGWPIKLGAILFCPLHEHIHAGQIGLIRRELGFDPVH